MERSSSPEEKPLDGQDLRRLAVETALATAFRDIRNPFITWEDLKQLIVVTMPDHARTRTWFESIRNYRNNGGINKKIDEYPEIEKLRDEVLVGICERVNMTDPLTIISAMNYNSQIYFNFRDFNPEIFIKSFLKHNGMIAQVSGLMGSGKTDFALTLADILLKNNFIVITNIKCKEANRIIRGQIIPGSIPNLYLTTRMTDLILQCIEMRTQGRNVVVIFDETSIFYNRQAASTRENIGLGMFLRLIRKFSASVIFIEQLEGGLSTIADILLVARYHKISRTKTQYSTSTLDRNYNLFLESTPPTQIKFDTLDFAGFDMDVNFKDMFESIDINSGEQANSIVGYIHAQMKRDELKQMPVEAMQQVAKMPVRPRKKRKTKSTDGGTGPNFVANGNPKDGGTVG